MSIRGDKSASLFRRELLSESLTQSFVKLNPRVLVRNPIMFTVEVCTAVMLVVTGYSAFFHSQGSFGYNLLVLIILFLTLLFANFAEAIAEARGKAREFHRAARCAIRPKSGCRAGSFRSRRRSPAGFHGFQT